MNSLEELSILREMADEESFNHRVKMLDRYPLCSLAVEILQINVSKACNLTCKHCHVQAGPDRDEIMAQSTLADCLKAIAENVIDTVDITGGAPETNPHLPWFLSELARFKKQRIIVRSNCVILDDKPYHKYIDFYAAHKVEIVTSLPDLQESRVERQRGKGSFRKFLAVLKELNGLGYGKVGSGLKLHIVHNPLGAYLSASQQSLEWGYKKRLQEEFGLVFNQLFTLNNIPIGRYLQFLLQSGNYEEYMLELKMAFNPGALDGVMCRNTISVGWDGKLYDCDFNQMLDLPINQRAGSHIRNFNINDLREREIVTENHCFGCVAGQGSSCQGSII